MKTIINDFLMEYDRMLGSKLYGEVTEKFNDGTYSKVDAQEVLATLRDWVDTPCVPALIEWITNRYGGEK
jgi:hypothetical protein